jgi:hypothetical protein
MPPALQQQRGECSERGQDRGQVITPDQAKNQGQERTDEQRYRKHMDNEIASITMNAQIARPVDVYGHS